MTRGGLQALLANYNIQAFLQAVRLGEGTSDEDGYKRIVGGSMFTDFSAHPNHRIFLPKYNVYSSAAGAYQIIAPTWNSLVKQYGFPDFSPDCQDEAAVALIAEHGGALDDIKAGRLADAVLKCSATWASLPGSKAGQRTESYNAVEEAYVAAGGTVAS